jgi:hypothetical protein
MAGRRRPPELPEPEKPVGEMTSEERDEHVRELRRALRDEQVRRGTRPPKTMRETQIWHEALVAKEEQAAKRIARAERKQQRDTRSMPERPENPGAVSDATPQEIAQWMASQLEQEGSLSQADAVDEIAKRFGEQFTYVNDSGNPAIDRRVLRTFRKVTGDTVVWERWDFCWRKRTERDAPGRDQG